MGVTLKLKPLQQWICDYCGKVISTPEDGSLEWLDDQQHRAHGFKIIHRLPASPRKLAREEGCCHYRKHPDESKCGLKTYLGTNGLVHLLAFLDVASDDAENKGPWVRNMREFVELFRRVQLPYYEEARLYWSDAEADDLFDGANQVSPYLEPALKDIVERYTAKEVAQ